MSVTTQSPSLHVRAADGGYYVIPSDVLQQYRVSDRGGTEAQGSTGKTLLVDVGKEQFAVPEGVAAQYRAPQGSEDDLDRLITQAEQDQEGSEVSGYMMSVWGLAAYSACFYGAWAGGGDAVAAGDYCWAKYAG